jgi:glycosyltransferase involved in cell wall biosynthesis
MLHLTNKVVNTRTLGHFTTGVQRYLCALLPYMVAPEEASQGMRGHLWEQFILPRKLGGDLLWSPANSGPITVGRQVLTLHDASILDHAEWYEGKYAYWYNWMLPKVVRKAARIITVSAHAKNRIVERLRVDESKVVAIANGVEPRFQPAAPEAIANLRRKLDLPEAFFLYVGSLEPRKNLPLLLKAWDRLQSKDFQLLVGGKAGHVFRRHGLTETRNVRFLGRVDDEDLPTLYSSAHAFIFPSLYEGFGLPLLEAMACGCPVISADTTSLPEVCGPAFDAVLQPDGAAAYFDPNDLESMVDSIRRMMDCSAGQRQQMSQNCLRRAARFSWKTAAAETLEVLESAAQERP